MSNEIQLDEVITVIDDVEHGFFYLENRQFCGPFERSEQAIEAARNHCVMTAPGECRAIYHGSVRLNHETRMREPLQDMRQIENVGHLHVV